MSVARDLAVIEAKLATRDIALYALTMTVLGQRSADDLKESLDEYDAAIEAAVREP